MRITLRLTGGPWDDLTMHTTAALVEMDSVTPPYVCMQEGEVWHHYACEYWSYTGPEPHGEFVYQGLCTDNPHPFGPPGVS